MKRVACLYKIKAPESLSTCECTRMCGCGQDGFELRGWKNQWRVDSDAEQHSRMGILIQHTHTEDCAAHNMSLLIVALICHAIRKERYILHSQHDFSVLDMVTEHDYPHHVAPAQQLS